MTYQLPRTLLVRRWAVRALRLLLALGFGFLCAELSLRFLVLSETSANWGLVERLKLPAAFGSPQSDDAYWEVTFLGLPPAQRIDHPEFDAELGWSSYSPVGPDHAHPGESPLNGRRPLLLFGDSFGRGVLGVTAGDFESQFEASTLSEEFAFLNFASGGYGLDQIQLCLQRTVERLAPERPVVVASFYVDDDIDRCALSFRCWPKPRLRVVDGQLQRDQPSVPRVAEYFASHSVLKGSLTGMVLANSAARLASRQQRMIHDSEKRELARALLSEMVDELRSRDIEFIFVLFVGRQALDEQQGGDWREALAVETLESLQAPWLCVRPALRAHAQLSGRELSEYFVPDNHFGRGHLNSLGNAVAYQAIQEGLARYLAIGPAGDLGLLPQDFRVLTDPPGPAAAQWRAESIWVESFCGPGPHIVHSAQPGRRTRLSWQLRGAARAIRMRVAAPLGAAGEGALPVVRVLADGRELARCELTAGAAPKFLTFDVTAASLFELEIERTDSLDTPQGVVFSGFTLVSADLPRRQPPLR